MVSRRDPSTSKVQYLLHLRECHVSCAQACIDNAILARSIRAKIELPACQYLDCISDDLQAHIIDLGYLADTLNKSIVHIDEVKRLAVNQMEIFDKRRNIIIGLLIAVYVPLTFTTVSTSPYLGKAIAHPLLAVVLRHEHRRQDNRILDEQHRLNRRFQCQ
jgi:hypothetical protein